MARFIIAGADAEQVLLAILTTAAGLASATWFATATGITAGTATTTRVADDAITVQGSATARGVPDRAQLSFGVETQAATAKAALNANGAEMRKVIAAVKAAGGTNVQTQSVSLSPRYDEKNGVTGYVATNTVVVTAADLAKAGTMIDAAVGAGANQVYGPSLAVSDQAELYRKALTGAVANARTKAQALATAAGVSLGRITTVVENGGSAPIPLDVAKSSAEGMTPIEPGSQELGASVTVTFSIR